MLTSRVHRSEHKEDHPADHKNGYLSRCNDAEPLLQRPFRQASTVYVVERDDQSQGNDAKSKDRELVNGGDRPLQEPPSLRLLLYGHGLVDRICDRDRDCAQNCPIQSDQGARDYPRQVGKRRGEQFHVLVALASGAQPVSQEK